MFNKQKLLEKFFEIFRVKAAIGGLEISDSALRFSYFDGKEWRKSALRLPPGILEKGFIKNKNQFSEALSVLKKSIIKEFLNFKSSKQINVIATLGSVNVYSRVFTLPLLEGDNLEDAIQLNARMLSPIDLDKSYFSWQIVSRDTQAAKMEIFISFLERGFADEIIGALDEAGFLAIALEFGAMSVSRLVKEKGAGFDSQKSYIVLHLDSNGLDFLLIRKNHLYFEYFNSWSDILGEKKEIIFDDLREAIARNLRQVLNFYSSNWNDKPADLILSTKAFGEEIHKVVGENFSLNIIDLRLKDGISFDHDWFLSLGGGLRGLVLRSQDEDINLSGMTSREEFMEQQALDFLGFWRILTPAALAGLLLALFISGLFLGNLRKSVEANPFIASADQIKKFQTLSSQVKNFNSSVSLISGVENSLLPKNKDIGEFFSILSQTNITLNRLTFSGYGQNVAFSGEAKSEDDIRNFNSVLAANPKFSDVNLNLSDIRPSGNGYSFTLTFLMEKG